MAIELILMESHIASFYLLDIFEQTDGIWKCVCYTDSYTWYVQADGQLGVRI